MFLLSACHLPVILLPVAGKTRKSCRAGAPPAVVREQRQPERLPYSRAKGETPLSSSGKYPKQPERIGAINSLDGITLAEDSVAVGRAQPPGEPSDSASGAPSRRARPVQPLYSDDDHGIWLYQGICLATLDAITDNFSVASIADAIESEFIGDRADDNWRLSNAGWSRVFPGFP